MKALTHGHYTNGRRSRTYRSWEAMIQRCYNPKNSAYSRYGALDITSCKAWRLFENFLEDMGECPEEYVLDRIDNNKGYYKENCRWVTNAQSGQNTSRVVLTMEKAREIRKLCKAGVKQVDIAEQYEVTPQTVSYIKNGKQWKEE